MHIFYSTINFSFHTHPDTRLANIFYRLFGDYCWNVAIVIWFRRRSNYSFSQGDSSVGQLLQKAASFLTAKHGEPADSASCTGCGINLTPSTMGLPTKQDYPEVDHYESSNESAAEGDDEDEDENIWVKNVRNFPLSPATVDCKRECSMAFRTQPPWMHFGTRSRRKQTDMPGMLIFYPGHFHSFILCTCVCFGCMGVKVAHVIVKTGVV